MNMRTSLFAATLVVLAAAAHAQPAPVMTDEAPAPGKRVRVVTPEYKGTQVYHALYLPTDWKKGERYPVIVEYAGTTHTVERCHLGYYQSGGKGFIWVVMPWVEVGRKTHALAGFGDRDATVAYCKTNLVRISETYGGDTGAVFLTGFSRGAWASAFVGLADEEIADAWLAFQPHSGYHFSALGPMSRIGRRATFLSWGELDGLKGESMTAKILLEAQKSPVATFEIPGTDHSDRWIMHDCPARRAIRKWFADTLENRPGTSAISGHVVTADRKPVPGVRIASGTMHWTFTNARGEYLLRGLMPGKRTLTATADGWTFEPAVISITLGPEDLTARDFTALPTPQ